MNGRKTRRNVQEIRKKVYRIPMLKEGDIVARLQGGPVPIGDKARPCNISSRCAGSIQSFLDGLQMAERALS